MYKPFLNKMTENDTTTNSVDEGTTTLPISDPPYNIYILGLWFDSVTVILNYNNNNGIAKSNPIQEQI